MLFSVTYGATYAYADVENDFTTITNDDIQNDPLFAKILENIEKSKKDISDIQQKANQARILDEQRSAAQNILELELKQMFKDNENFTPLKTFNRFLATVSDDDTKVVFQGLFDYKEEKVNSAKNALDDVLKNGGTLQEARNAYHEAAKIPRADMIQLVTDLNVKAGFSDSDIQKHFDDEGKLPRYDDQQESVLSFVDLTTSVKNVNSSTNSTSVEDVTQSLDNTDTTNDADTEFDDSEKTIIQKLLEEIQFLKDKVKELEKTQNIVVQQAVFEQGLDSIRFANWVSDYSQGLGHYNHKVHDIKSIPVNALNEPDSYVDANNALSLGRQGQVTIGFSEPVTDKLIVYETSMGQNIGELAMVEVSMDGENWIPLKQTQYRGDDSYVHQYIYDLSDVECISHVRITDDAPSGRGDGFDVDAVGATKTCTDTT